MLDKLLQTIIYIAFIFVDLYIYLRIFYREKLFNKSLINNISFNKYYVLLNDEKHSVTELGDKNADSNNTLILIGGIPSDPTESMMWLAKELYYLNPSLRIIILHMPYYENHFKITPSHLYSKNDGLSIFHNSINLKSTKIDPRFSHINQSKTVDLILEKLSINKAHLIGHDRGAVILENLCMYNPSRVLSYSRAAQLWNYLDPEWEKLAPAICVGPPHSMMAIRHQFRVLFLMIMFGSKPLHLLSESFKNNAIKSKKGSDLYDRYTHLKYKTQVAYKKFYYKFQQSILQGGVKQEVDARVGLMKLSIPIMQFQGQDEFKKTKSGDYISDQPYFGVYNLFRNEIEDIYPGCVFQDESEYKSEFVTKKEHYSEVKLKKDARFSRFCLIPDSAHFNVIENPESCAHAINDFINSINSNNI